MYDKIYYAICLEKTPSRLLNGSLLNNGFMAKYFIYEIRGKINIPQVELNPLA